MGTTIAPPHLLDSSRARTLMKALADPIRLQVIEELACGERCVCDLINELSLGQSRLSFHLKVLKDAGLIVDRQSGRWVYYRLETKALGILQDWLSSLAEQCQKPTINCE